MCWWLTVLTVFIKQMKQVSVPKDLVAVMSAVRDGQDVDPQDSSRIIYRFRQSVSSSTSSFVSPLPSSNSRSVLLFLLLLLILLLFLSTGSNSQSVLLFLLHLVFL